MTHDTRLHFLIAHGAEPSRPIIELVWEPTAAAGERLTLRPLTDEPREQDWLPVVRGVFLESQVFDPETHKPVPPPHTETAADVRRGLGELARTVRALVTYPAGMPAPPPLPGVRKFEIDSATHLFWRTAVDDVAREYHRAHPGFDRFAFLRGFNVATEDELIERTLRLCTLPGVDVRPVQAAMQRPGLDADLVTKILVIVDAAVSRPPAPAEPPPLPTPSGRLYACADCNHRFDPGPDRTTPCLSCGTPADRGTITCRHCDHRFLADMPHWHRSCNLANAPCPKCGQDTYELCIC